MGRTHDVTISGFDLDRIEAELRKAISERNKARDSVREMRDILKGMNFGDSFPVVKRAIKNADSILSNIKMSCGGTPLAPSPVSDFSSEDK